MRKPAAVFRMYMRDKLSWLLLPWIILLSSFFVNLIIGATIQEPDGFYTGGLMSIFIYLFVGGAITLHQTFPFSMGMGVRRTDYFLGTAATFAAVSAMTSVILILLGLVEKEWTDGWGVGLHFFHLPFVNEGSIFLQGVTMFLLLLNMFFSGFWISSIYRRFGRNGMYTFFALLFLIFAPVPVLITYYDRWDDIGRWVEGNIESLSDLAPWLVLAVVFYAACSYVFLRRSTV